MPVLRRATRSPTSAGKGMAALALACVLAEAGTLGTSTSAMPSALAATTPVRVALPVMVDTPSGSSVDPAAANAEQSASERAAADRAKAAQISAQLEAQGLLLAKLAERADAESVRSQQLDRQLRATQSASARAKKSVQNTKALLVDQAVAAYTEGGAFSYAPGIMQGTSLAVAATYAEFFAHDQRLVLGEYETAVARDRAIFSELLVQRASVRAATRQLRTDRAAASAQQSALRKTLAQVKGNLVEAVAEVQRQQAALQAAEEKAYLASIDQLPSQRAAASAERASATENATVRHGAEKSAALPATTTSTSAPAQPVPTSPTSSTSSTASTATTSVNSTTGTTVPSAILTTADEPASSTTAPSTTAIIAPPSSATTTVPVTSTPASSTTAPPESSTAVPSTTSSAAASLGSVTTTSTSAVPVTTVSSPSTSGSSLEPATTTTLAGASTTSSGSTTPASLGSTTASGPGADLSAVGGSTGSDVGASAGSGNVGAGAGGAVGGSAGSDVGAGDGAGNVGAGGAGGAGDNVGANAGGGNVGAGAGGAAAGLHGAGAGGPTAGLDGSGSSEGGSSGAGAGSEGTGTATVGAGGAGGPGAEPTTAPPSTDAATLASTTSTTTATVAPAFNSEAPGAQTALAFAESQLGKPYQWGGAGPTSYDCSGLTMVAWEKAGVSLPHSAQDQYDLTQRVPLSDLQPGDLVFFGTPTDVYHVGMYVGGGDMVDAPETGQDVSIQPIYELNLLGGGRIR